MARRPRLSAPSVSTVPAFALPAGQSPVPDVIDASGAIVLRGWQSDAYDVLSVATLRILLAPTGYPWDHGRDLACDQ